MGEVKVLIQVEGETVHVTPLGLTFQVKREVLETICGAFESNAYIRDIPVQAYQALANGS